MTLACRTDEPFEYAPDDDNHILQETPYAKLDLTPLQTTRVNSALAAKEDPERFLSPTQRQRID